MSEIQCFDDDGSPLAHGKVYVYGEGKRQYFDLDGNGKTEIKPGDYRIVVKKQDDTIVYCTFLYLAPIERK